jgi:hypothetical protein
MEIENAKLVYDTKLQTTRLELIHICRHRYQAREFAEGIHCWLISWLLLRRYDVFI